MEYFFTYFFWSYPRRGFSSCAHFIHDNRNIRTLLKVTKTIHSIRGIYDDDLSIGRNTQAIKRAVVSGLIFDDDNPRFLTCEPILTTDILVDIKELEGRRFFVNGVVSEFRRRGTRFNTLTVVAEYGVNQVELLMAVLGMVVWNRFKNTEKLSEVGGIEDIRKGVDGIFRFLTKKYIRFDRTPADLIEDPFQYALSALYPAIVSDEEDVYFCHPYLFGSFEKDMRTIFYRRTEEERIFLRGLEELAGRLAENWSYGKLRERIITRVASSSIYATEEMLLRLQDVWRPMRNKIAHEVPWTDSDVERIQQQLSMATDEPDVIDELSEGITIQPEEFLAFYRKLESLLDQIENIPADPKLDALIRYIRESWEAKDRCYLCIVSSFMNTVQYINSNIQDIGIPVYSLTSSLQIAERLDTIKAFETNGGLLIATDAGLEGVGLQNVDECINYDLPLNMQMLEQRWHRFIRFGRKSKFTMIFLRDQSEALPWEEDLFKALKDKSSSKEKIR